jgi:hypothetical protein
LSTVPTALIQAANVRIGRRSNIVSNFTRRSPDRWRQIVRRGLSWNADGHAQTIVRRSSPRCVLQTEDAARADRLRRFLALVRRQTPVSDFGAWQARQR